MKYDLVFCHGWAFDRNYFKFLAEKYFFNMNYYLLDIGYFNSSNMYLLDLLRNKYSKKFIGIGHSLGFLKLLLSSLKFEALIGIQSFINFLGFTKYLRKKRRNEFDILWNFFIRNERNALMFFYKRCGFKNSCNKNINKFILRKDLRFIYDFNLNFDISVPILILASKDDNIVPIDLIYDNFGKCCNIITIETGSHCLGIYECSFVYRKIINFLDEIK
ncbi:hypothetical protein [Candidatus Legionella polyplacis]|uniref:Alpha/beta hydrolase family protein n=1 Tax=Candidatus Legionella polyplacis TaxID=2005262 RepID=A0ABZ2H0H8_9GAMM